MTLSKNIGEFTMTNGGRPGGGRGRRRRLLDGLCPGVLFLLIQLYRWTVSPALTFLFGANSGCRFTPTCSEYAMEAVQRHGASAGSVLAVKRICRCHPFGGCGEDLVPERGSEDSRHDSKVVEALHELSLSPRPSPPGGRVQGLDARAKLEGKGFHG